MENRKFLRGRDMILIVVVLAAAAIAYFIFSGMNAGKGDRAELYVNGVLVKTISLSGPDETFTVPEREDVVLELRDHAIGFVKSNCPDKVCIRAGMLDKPGQAAACLPNEVVLKIIGSGSTDITVG